MREFIYQLFGKYGLVVLDPDDKQLKTAMIPVFKDELLNRNSERLVTQTISMLEKDKLKVQAKGRDINLFYLSENNRERIIFENGNYLLAISNEILSESQIIERLEQHPECFSPNVILRPLYQETILPNVAFVGGGGEIAYWSELKSVFEYYEVSFPPILRRNSVLIVDKSTTKKIQKTNLEIKHFLQPIEELENYFLKINNSIVKLEDFHFDLERNFESLLLILNQVDIGLIPKLNADKNLFYNKLEEWEKRINKQMKLKNELALNQIRSIYNKIYPENSLQERYESSVSAIAQYGLEIIDELVQNLNPLNKHFIIMQAE
jgi:bacillithiol biosynthesis cysteine-adding enzyme BshC